MASRCRPRSATAAPSTLLSLASILLTVVLLSSWSPSARADPPHPDPVAIGCGLQLWCTPTNPCLPQQATLNTFALVTFDLSPMTINYTAAASASAGGANVTDYLASDAIFTYHANVCAPIRNSCPGQPEIDLYGMAAETIGDKCYISGHQPQGFQLVDPLDATQGVQIEYINGDVADCTGGAANPRRTNYIYTCGETAPANPFIQGSFQPENACNYTFVFESILACPTITYYQYPPTPAGAHGLSGGSIFLIVFFVLGFVYVLATMAYNYVRLGARTWSGLRPHPAFWSGLVGLVVDGCRFTSLWVRARCDRSARVESEANHYQDIDGAPSAKPTTGGNSTMHSIAAADEEETTNYSSHFHASADEVGIAGHAPLTPQPRQSDGFDAFGEDVASGSSSGGGGGKGKKGKK